MGGRGRLGGLLSEMWTWPRTFQGLMFWPSLIAFLSRGLPFCLSVPTSSAPPSVLRGKYLQVPVLAGPSLAISWVCGVSQYRLVPWDLLGSCILIRKMGMMMCTYRVAMETNEGSSEPFQPSTWEGSSCTVLLLNTVGLQVLCSVSRGVMPALDVHWARLRLAGYVESGRHQ